MILHTPLPLEQVLEGWDKLRNPTMELTLGHAVMEIEPINAKQARIVRLISPYANDYLAPEFAPGTIVEWGWGSVQSSE